MEIHLKYLTGKLPKIDFPKNFNENTFFILVICFYCLFSIHFENYLPDSLDLNLCKNDFNESGMVVWFFETLLGQFFILLLTRTGTILIKDRLVKSLFYAMFIDSMFSILNTLIFGYYVSDFSLLIRNISVILAMIYAYFILYDGHPNTRT
jgi:hypothetical protein